MFFNKSIFKSLINRFTAASLIIFFLLCSFPSEAYAAKSTQKSDPLIEALEYNRTLPIQTDAIENWPVGPVISAYSAILMDADTGVILYSKNAYETMYPASTTKLMTCLLAVESESAQLDDLVPFSYDAVMSIPWDGSNMGMNVGDKMTLEECLYGVLVVSANEVANAVGEYIGGDPVTFVNMMNVRAKELGCINTHFNNAHGYSDPDHYTCAYDLARIGRAFFSNELLCKISSTKTYHWYATEYQPDDIQLTCKNYFVSGRVGLEGFVGSKTGYTGESRQVLVTCAERNGMKLIAVVMKEETPYQYEDTATLFEYGFTNFEKIRVSDYETRFTVTKDDFFKSEKSVFGNSGSIFNLDSTAHVIVPKTTGFAGLNASIKYNEDSNSSTIATVSYDYNGIAMGSANILYKKSSSAAFIFNDTDPEIKDDENLPEEEEPTFIYINYIIYGAAAIVLLILVITLIVKISSSFHFSERRSAFKRHRKKRMHNGPDYTKTTRRAKKKVNKGYTIDLYEKHK